MNYQISTFIGSMSAYGGLGFGVGAPGTIYDSQRNRIEVNNNGNEFSVNFLDCKRKKSKQPSSD